MKKIVTALLVAGAGLWASTASAEDTRIDRRAIPDSAIETGNGMWSPAPSPTVIYGRPGRFLAPASSTEGAYVSASVGEAAMNNVNFSNYNGFGRYNSGITMLGAVGYGFKNNCRLEGEVGYQANDNNNDYYGASFNNRNISVLFFLANGYYDIPVFGGAQPYITAGIGVANVNANGIIAQGGLPNIPSVNETAFAYQLGVGITIPINNNIKLDARYRYFATNVIVDSLFDNTRLSSNSVLLGLKIGI